MARIFNNGMPASEFSGNENSQRVEGLYRQMGLEIEIQAGTVPGKFVAAADRRSFKTRLTDIAANLFIGGLPRGSVAFVADTADGALEGLGRFFSAMAANEECLVVEAERTEPSVQGYNIYTPNEAGEAVHVQRFGTMTFGGVAYVCDRTYGR